MQIISRPFGGDADFELLQAFLMTATAAGSAYRYLHVGDVLWGFYRTLVFDPCQHVRLWERVDGDLLGFAWFDPPNVVTLQVHPHFRGTSDIEEQMLAWAETHRITYMGAQVPPLTIGAFEDDPQRITLLEQHGFARADEHLEYMQRNLSARLPSVRLAPGMTLRHIQNEAEYAARVALHHAVYPGSQVTLDSYRRMRTMPGYLPELDLVAVTADGTFVAYCICWLDPVNRYGLFEPVGTHPAWRAQGLGKAVMGEGFQRLHSYRATTATLVVESTNEPAKKLYESVGFQTIAKDYS
ncbi:MAG TPA: GNAT family N-acetyltransferase [Herpetosiphonaceae bacterium]|nr:GNAT family N-acetyltransferase [Herpetosiphonaceae bacterium]